MVRKNLKKNKSVRKGFANMFRVVVVCLKAKRVPTAENLESSCNNWGELLPDTKNYLQHAGLQIGCWAVLRHIFDAAKEENDKVGNGECQDLPTCRNDLEFEFVARAYGYGGNDFMT
ncbi:hypothetical protein N7486_008905 [Penicillium sp. IBT 16267x]|nr:hypothetical protein N7486_008905 [Penicillium sp. IBT 16267x]